MAKSREPDSTLDLDGKGVWQTSIAKLVSMECGDVINISGVSVWYSMPSPALQLKFARLLSHLGWSLAHETSMACPVRLKLGDVISMY